LPESIHEQGSRDTRLLKKVIEQRWPISDKIRQAVINRQVKTLLNAGTSNRDATAAARTIIAADSQNQADEHILIKQPEQHLHLHQHEAGHEPITTAELVKLVTTLGTSQVIDACSQLVAVESSEPTPVEGVAQ